MKFYIKEPSRILINALRFFSQHTKTLIIADGFSWREQIEQLKGCKGFHTIHLLQMALRQYGEFLESAMEYPEKKYADGMKLNSPNLNAKRRAAL